MRSTLRRRWDVPVPMLGVMAVGHPSCGPCEIQAGKSVLLAIPIMVAVGFLFQWLYRLCWKPLRQLTIFDRKSTRVIVVVATLLAAIGLLAPHNGFNLGEFEVFAVILVGPSYLTFLVVGLRVGVQVPGRQWWNRYVLLLSLGFIAPLSLWFALFGSHQDADMLGNVLMAPGWLGLVAGPLLLLLFAEPLIHHTELDARSGCDSNCLPRA